MADHRQLGGGHAVGFQLVHDLSNDGHVVGVASEPDVTVRRNAGTDAGEAGSGDPQPDARNVNGLTGGSNRCHRL